MVTGGHTWSQVGSMVTFCVSDHVLLQNWLYQSCNLDFHVFSVGELWPLIDLRGSAAGKNGVITNAKVSSFVCLFNISYAVSDGATTRSSSPAIRRT